MLTARRLGMPIPAVTTHGETLKYFIKTQFGISNAFIQSRPGVFLFGTGQGSGASPAVWLSISTVLLSSLSKLTPRGMIFSDPSRLTQLERFSDAFVDDNQNGLNDAGLEEPWPLPLSYQSSRDVPSLGEASILLRRCT